MSITPETTHHQLPRLPQRRSLDAALNSLTPWATSTLTVAVQGVVSQRISYKILTFL